LQVVPPRSKLESWSTSTKAWLEATCNSFCATSPQAFFVSLRLAPAVTPMVAVLDGLY
jgi:hypothetical protein